MINMMRLNPKSQYYQIPNKSQVPENEKKRVVIARKEAKETKYWLRLISEKFINKKIIIKDINETQELVNILNAIIRNSKCNH